MAKGEAPKKSISRKGKVEPEKRQPRPRPRLAVTAMGMADDVWPSIADLGIETTPESATAAAAATVVVVAEEAPAPVPAPEPEAHWAITTLEETLHAAPREVAESPVPWPSIGPERELVNLQIPLAELTIELPAASEEPVAVEPAPAAPLSGRRRTTIPRAAAKAAPVTPTRSADASAAGTAAPKSDAAMPGARRKSAAPATGATAPATGPAGAAETVPSTEAPLRGRRRTTIPKADAKGASGDPVAPRDTPDSVPPVVAPEPQRARKRRSQVAVQSEPANAAPPPAASTDAPVSAAPSTDRATDPTPPVVEAHADAAPVDASAPLEASIPIASEPAPPAEAPADVSPVDVPAPAAPLPAPVADADAHETTGPSPKRTAESRESRQTKPAATPADAAPPRRLFVPEHIARIMERGSRTSEPGVNEVPVSDLAGLEQAIMAPSRPPRQRVPEAPAPAAATWEMDAPAAVPAAEVVPDGAALPIAAPGWPTPGEMAAAKQATGEAAGHKAYTSTRLTPETLGPIEPSPSFRPYQAVYEPHVADGDPPAE